MDPHVWQLVVEHDDPPRRHTAHAGHVHDTAGRVLGTGAAGTGAAGTALAGGTASSAADALEEAFDAAEMRVLRGELGAFVLLLDGEQIRIAPSPDPACVDLNLAMLAGLRHELHLELQGAGR
ncbi:hypothetical protein ACIA8G_35330 [Lentzea sp. NPDC051213]|uniref:hypothetical protein n=1 Tax=Lentzea sp. NPDC051213 TaxID=3364126 RepID=UPI0037B53D6F